MKNVIIHIKTSRIVNTSIYVYVLLLHIAFISLYMYIYCHLSDIVRMHIYFEREWREFGWLHSNKTMTDWIALLDQTSHDQQNNGYIHPETVSLLRLLINSTFILGGGRQFSWKVIPVRTTARKSYAIFICMCLHVYILLCI